MAKTKQNQVPFEFDALYGPILKLKKLLHSKAKELSAEQIVQGFVMLHYATFIMVHFHKQLRMSRNKDLITRELIELIMSNDSYKIQPDQLAKLFSFIDALAKELNMTYKPYVYVAMYEAYLDAEIYRHLHPTLGIYDFVEFHYVRPETVASMKQYYGISVKVLSELELSPKEQPTIDKTMKLKSMRVS